MARPYGQGASRSSGAKLQLISVSLVATENMENVKGLADVIDLKANPPLPDSQTILRRIYPG